jgi:hypothetical protein
MSAPTNIFKKFEVEIENLENHLKSTKSYKTIINTFFLQIQYLTVSAQKSLTSNP